jgi:hypothetical protein
MNKPDTRRRGRIPEPISRPTSWWLQTLRQRAKSMYDEELDLSQPVTFTDDEERLACIAFFNAALRAEESGHSQAENLASRVREWDSDLAECLVLYGAEENWHRGLIVGFLNRIGGEIRPLGGMTKIFYTVYAQARELETIMLTNLMFETIGSTTYRIALGRVQQPCVRRMLTILARDESFHVPLNVHFIRAMLAHRERTWMSEARLRAVYQAVYWALLASSAASRRVARRFDRISFVELSRAYAENLGRLFVREPDLRLEPPAIALRLFGLKRDQLLDGEYVTSAAAAEAAARREDVTVSALNV